MKKFLWIFALLALAGGGYLGVHLWRVRVAHTHETRAFGRAESLFAEGRITETAAIVQAFGARPGNRLPWADLDFRVLVAQANLPRLTAIFGIDPDRVLADEAASLTAARAFLHLRQPAEYGRIRSAWNGRERDRSRWLLLDADRLLIDGQVAQAEEILRAGLGGEAQDVPKLLRLALVVAGRNPQESVEFLNRAAAVDSRQPDARSLRGQVLEALGRPAHARVEYVAAVVADPSNPIWRDQLAEFYRRQGNADLALRTWSEAMEGPAFDAIWVKASFWARMIDPAGLSSTPRRPSAGPLAPLYRFVKDLPEDRFFDDPAFAALPDAGRFDQARQEVFWLRLTESLRQGRETEALQALASRRPDSPSWEPGLERALARILSWRNTPEHTLTPPGFPIARTPRSDPRLPSFWAALEDLADSQANPTSAPAAATRAELEGVLAGKYAFAGAFLAAGWREAALRLAGDAPLPSGSPVWLTYGLAQALRYNRGHAQALAFLAPHKNVPALDLLTAEIALAEGNADEARTTLQSLAPHDSDVGMRAAWLLGVDALEVDHPAEARRFVRANPRLATHTSGRELLARAALAEGDVASANRIYEGIADQSPEAQAFLARQAFEARDWDRAQSLTLSLLDRWPDELGLRAHLGKLASARPSP